MHVLVLKIVSRHMPLNYLVIDFWCRPYGLSLPTVHPFHELQKQNCMS